MSVLVLLAQQRIHGTTGIKPAVRLTEERMALMPLPLEPQTVVTTPCEGVGLVPFESLQHPLQQYDLVQGIAYESAM